MKNNKKAISLIVLVITIIVMIILAASVVITLSNTGIIDRANEATYETELKQIQDLAALAWSDAYTAKMTDPSINIEEEIRLALEKQGITRDRYIMEVTNNGVTIKAYTKTGSIKNTTVSGQPPLAINNSAGVELLDYKIYGESIQNGTPTPVAPAQIQSVGEKTKNLFNKSKSPTYTNAPHVTIEEIKTGIRLINSAILSEGPYCAEVYAIDKVENIGAKTVNFSTDVKLVGVPRTAIILGYCDENGENRKTVKTIYPTEDGKYTLSMNIDAETYAGQYLCLWLYSIAVQNETALDSGTSVEYSNIMLSIGENEYEPYGYRIPIKVSNGTDEIVTNIYLNEPLRRIGEYADYIDYANKKVVRKIASQYVNTVQYISAESTQYRRFLTDIEHEPLLIETVNGSNAVTTKRGIAISNKFSLSEYSYTTLGTHPELIQTYKTTAGVNRVAYTFDDISITTIAQAQEKIGNGFEVCYVMLNEKNEAMEFLELPTLRGTTILNVETTVRPSNIEVTYSVIE